MGINTYTGLTTVNEGVLAIDGSIIGDVLVQQEGKLKGKGTIFGVVTVEGTLSTSKPFCTITLGNLVCNASAKTSIELDREISSSITVHGNATLGGALKIKPIASEFEKKRTYKILSASSITGKYSSINKVKGFKFKIAYDETGVYLTVYSKKVL